MIDDCPDFIDDIDSCYWCSNCRLRLEDCTCHFDEPDEDYYKDD